MGSGKLIKRAINKYGVKNFTKEILFVFDNETEMYNKEKELVVVSENTYDLCPGGDGGFGYINENKLNGFYKEGVREKAAKNGGIRSYMLKAGIHSLTEEERKIVSKKAKNARDKKYPKGTFFGKTHKQETIELLKKKAVGKHTAEKNSQFSTCQVTNGIENKKIKKEEIDFYASLNYKRGRCMK